MEEEAGGVDGVEEEELVDGLEGLGVALLGLVSAGAVDELDDLALTLVALELLVDAGLLREAKPGLGYLTGRLLEPSRYTGPLNCMRPATK